MFGRRDKDQPPEKTEKELRAERYADPNADCPYWQAPCKKHACRFYKQIQGMNPNTGDPINQFDCAIAWLPFLLIENSQQQRQTGASTDKVANEIDKFRSHMVKQNSQLLEGYNNNKRLELQDGGDRD